VERAADLRNADTIGLSDPYAIVRVGQTRLTTKRVANCLDPEWGEEFSFFVENSATTKVHITVMDHDATSSDDPLGDLSLSVAEVQTSQDGRLRGEWPLEHTPRGRITLALLWKPY
jgi:Ca2+-dependent lipid-binding protein